MTVSSIFWIFFTTAFLECQIWSFWFSYRTSLKNQAILRLWILLSFRNEGSVYSFLKKMIVFKCLLSVKLVLKTEKCIKQSLDSLT